MTAPRLLAAALALLLPAAAWAQTSTLEIDRDLRITAEESLEWHRTEQTYVARGNAVARHKDQRLSADKLVAFYREAGDDGEGDSEADGGLLGAGNTEIYRVEATGGVRVTTPSATVMGARGIYDLNEPVVVMLGDDLRLETENGATVTAEDRLEFWPGRDLAVARGNAVATSGDRELRARVIQAVFTGEGEARELTRLEAFDNVRIRLADGNARAETGVYETGADVAELFGSVRLERGGTRLQGGYARVDMASGRSELRAAAPEGDAETGVRGLIEKPTVEPASEGAGNSG
ncbi:lipopolysaccharide export system protein LptA [Limimonas halophila]|uniref:Lipopolysaccharide export system protein LptA n=1 Tax=Limimonas halophila TaxID=1082479 RepID=A0A1G7TEL6_9PROT|nr:LptA/OstA family protein [Limimonas halophila]SDG33109.1 lipopolysaccharide export system protein LptA [Limimonas halophila]